MLLFIQDYVRQEHIKKTPDGVKVDYTGSQLGKVLVSHLGKIGVGKKDFAVTYAYPKIPPAKKINDRNGKVLSYKDPTKKEIDAYTQELIDKIVKAKPSLLLPTGNIGCKMLLGQAKISALRGKPVQLDLQASDGEVYQVWCLPTFSQEFLKMSPNVVNLSIADFRVIGKFIREGESLFNPKLVEYTFLNNYEKVKEQFDYLYANRPATAWDLETNSLRAEVEGAKILVFTFSYKEGTGYTLPLFHKEWRQWNVMEQDAIWKLIQRFMEDELQVKVGHNTKFDMKWLMLTSPVQVFNNCRDTKTMYYLAVVQKLEASFKLSDLAYEFTDMGGYDQPLDDYKKQYKKDKLDEFLAERDKAKKEATLKINEEYKLASEDYKLQVAEYKSLDKDQKKRTPKPVKPKKGAMPKFPTKASFKLHNEVNPAEDFNYEWIPLKVLHPYASGDVDCCLRIYNNLIERVKITTSMYKLATEFYPKLARALARIEANGIRLDVEYTKQLEKDYFAEADRLTAEIREFPAVKQVESIKEQLYEIGVTEFAKPVKERDTDIVKLRSKYKDKTQFNPTSPEDKGRLMFSVLKAQVPYDKNNLKEKSFEAGIKEDDLTWEDYKTDKHVLGYLVDEGATKEIKELSQRLLNISKVVTLRNGFTTKLLLIRSGKDRIHGGYSETGTETSRLNSTNPNLQQLPSHVGDVDRFDYLHPIKRNFISEFAEEGGALFNLDYSALEMHITGLVSMDKAMTEAFLDATRDMHKETASLAFGVSLDEVTPDMRSHAKKVAFGLIYGETPQSFSAKNNMTVEEASDIFDKYFASKPAVKDYIERTQQKAMKDGYVETLQGHRRLIQDIFSKDRKVYNGAIRKVVNTQVQGTGAYLTNYSLVLIDDYLRLTNRRAKVVITVHDSILIDCPPDEVDEVIPACKTIMEQLPIPFLFVEWEGKTIRYPIKADAEIGLTYNDMVDFDLDEIHKFTSLKGYCEYQRALNTLRDYRDCSKITDEQYNQAIQQIEQAKPSYEAMKIS
jgi:DNA polymerase I-like protein with 3'-5' exonuclease and polymerase domains